MKNRAFPILAPATLALAACTTAPVLLPPEAELRDRLGRVAVVALTDSPRIRFQVPDSKADIAAEPSFFENVASTLEPVAAFERQAEKNALHSANAATFHSVSGRLDPFVGPGPYVPVAGVVGGAAYLASDVALYYLNPIAVFQKPPIVLQPILPEIRRAYGLAAAESTAALAAARAKLDAATAPVRLDAELRDRLAVEIGSAAHGVAKVASRAAADTVLELFLYEPNVSSPTAEGINPALGLSLGLRVRLLDARTGAELYYDYLDYRGPRHKFVAWAADDALVFRAELERCLAHLSREIVAQIFTRPAEQTASRSDLAALGIERRAPSPVAPGGSLWFPSRNRNVYARN